MKRIKALLYVDEEQLRKSTGDKESSVRFLVEQELGWCCQSGIAVESITEEMCDINGSNIEIGDSVIWHDPDKENEDLTRVYSVYDIKGDIVYILDEHSEAEVFPHELEVI